MNPNDAKLEAIYDAALELSPEEREIYVARACGNDPELRQRIDRLLKAFDRAGNFLTRGNTPKASVPAVDSQGAQQMHGATGSNEPTKLQAPFTELTEGPGTV